MIKIISFGYGHNKGITPVADITLDVRRLLRDPFRDPELMSLTGMSTPVREHVLNTKGVQSLVCSTAHLISALDFDLFGEKEITIAIGCVGGKHRAPAIAHFVRDMLIKSLYYKPEQIDIFHRDIFKPLIRK